MKFAGRHFLTTDDYSGEELTAILAHAEDLKRELRAGKAAPVLPGKTLAMIFQKPSNRTRLSFEIGMHQLGGKAVYISGPEIQMGEREPIADVSRVMSRYVDAVMIRSNYHSDIVEFSRYSSVPVINGLSDLEHPCQALADLLTVKEHKGALQNVSMCYIGDGNNVCNSLISICSKLGVKLSVACPPGYEPSGEERCASCRITHDPHDGVRGVDVVYTDTWISMGQEEQSRKRRRDFSAFVVTSELMREAAPGAIFMHCLPAHRGEEVENEVMESPASVIFDQAENRMHAQKAVLALLLGQDRSL